VVVRKMSVKNVFRLLASIVVFWGHAFGSAQAGQELLEERLVTVELKDIKVKQVLDEIGAQTGLTIDFLGPVPDEKKDISLTQVPVDRAISQIMRLYGIENHAAIYKPRSIVLKVFEANQLKVTLASYSQPQLDLYDYSPLTVEQLGSLKAESDIIIAEMKKSMQPLTPDEMGRVRERSDEIKSEMERSQEPLTPDEMGRLRERSDEIKSEMERSQGPLTSEEVQGLRKRSDQIKSEMERSQEPLTPDEMGRLRKLEPRK
jgi:hypothetical protein